MISEDGFKASTTVYAIARSCASCSFEISDMVNTFFLLVYRKNIQHILQKAKKYLQLSNSTPTKGEKTGSITATRVARVKKQRW